MEMTTQEILRNEYNAIKAINYSTLKKLDKHPSLLLEEHKELDETDVPFNMGHLFELLLDEENKEIKSKFLILETTINFPTDKYLKTINELIIYFNSLGIKTPNLEDVNEDIIVEIAKRNEIGGGSWKDYRIYNDIITKCKDYYNYKLLSENKIVITKESFNKVKNGVSLTKNGKYTNHILNTTNPNLIIENQKLIYQVIDGIEYKGLLDKVIIDRGRKRAYIYDYKTTTSSYKTFKRNIFKFRYDIQASLYKKLLQKELLDPDYEITYHLIVYSFSEEKDAIIYTIGDNLINTNWDKYFFTVNGYEYKTLLRLVEEYTYHTQNNVFDYDYEFLIRNGKIIIDV